MTDYDNYRGGHYGDTGYYNSRFLLYSNYSLNHDEYNNRLHSGHYGNSGRPIHLLGGSQSSNNYRYNPYEYYSRHPSNQHTSKISSASYDYRNSIYDSNIVSYDVAPTQRGSYGDYDLYYSNPFIPNENNIAKRVHMRGIPFRVTGKEIEDFFAPLRCIEIKIGFFDDGRATGDGFVEFATSIEASEALKRDYKTMGSRYIELFMARDIYESRKLKLPHGAFYKTISGREQTSWR